VMNEELLPVCPCDALPGSGGGFVAQQKLSTGHGKGILGDGDAKLGRLWLSQQALACPARSSHARAIAWRPSAAACAASHAAGRASPGVAAPAACRAAATASSPSPILQSAKKDCERFVSLEVGAAAIPSVHEPGAWRPLPIVKVHHLPHACLWRTSNAEAQKQKTYAEPCPYSWHCLGCAVHLTYIQARQPQQQHWLCRMLRRQRNRRRRSTAVRFPNPNQNVP